MYLRFLFTSFFFLLLIEIVNAQISSNVSLITQLSPDTTSIGRYSGCWGYVSPSGNEYAIVGSYDGTYFIDITDSTNVHLMDFVPGIEADWREIKVVNNYAYVVSQIFYPGNYMQVIDLSFLPDSVHLAAIYDSTFSSAHTIEINDDGYDGYIYVNGPVNYPELGGVHILDISDPSHPVEKSVYSNTFIHDCVVKGNLLYACNSPNQTIDVVDISDRSNPILIGQIACCGNIHSGDLTPDGKFLFATQEIPKTPAHIFDVHDLSNITEVAQYRGEDSAIVHNVYIHGIEAYVANNDGGLRVVDLHDPTFPVEVGHYDTYLEPSGIQHGLFTLFPFFPSGKIIGTDRGEGLFVWRFNGSKPVRVYCHVEDAVSGSALFNASVTSSPLADTGRTDIYGNYKTSFLQHEYSSISLTITADGYNSKTITRGVNDDADSIRLNVKLIPLDDSTITSLNVYPTLVYQTISVLNEDNSPTPATLKIFNLLGQLQFEFTIPESNLPSEIDVSSLSLGIYFVQLSQSNHSIRKKIIKD